MYRWSIKDRGVEQADGPVGEQEKVGCGQRSQVVRQLPCHGCPVGEPADEREEGPRVSSESAGGKPGDVMREE